jgi:hypothetical protein
MREGADPTSELRRGESVQSALYRIAELAGAAQDLQEFYRAVHGVVGELMNARNFYIALYDEERQLINWPYYIDEVDRDIPDPNQWDAFARETPEGRPHTCSARRAAADRLRGGDGARRARRDRACRRHR